MELTSAKVSQMSAKGNVRENPDIYELDEMTDTVTSSADSVSYRNSAFGWILELFYGGGFKISSAEHMDEFDKAKEFIEEELGLTIREFELLRATVIGDLKVGQSSTRPELVSEHFEQNTKVSDIEYGDATGGDVCFKYKSWTVRLFFESGRYVVQNVRASSEEQVDKKLETVQEDISSLLPE